MLYNAILRLIAEPKFRAVYRGFKAGEEFNFLDIGCGNHSVASAKKHFKNCRYYGLDKGIYNNTAEDFSNMDKFYDFDLEKDDFSVIPDDFFSVILVNHVIEHIKNGLEAVEKLSHKLKKGGIIYVEFPSEKSLSLPSMEGTLHFCDDLSHVRLYSIKEICNVLLENKIKVIKAGPRRDKIRIMATPFRYIYRKMRNSPRAGVFWDILGFADVVIGQRR
jgi:SAM-dependent methyltransferase